MMTEGFYHPELWTLMLGLMGDTRWSRHKRAHDSLPVRSLAVHFAIITWIIRRRPAAQRPFILAAASVSYLAEPAQLQACVSFREGGGHGVWPPRDAQVQKLFMAAIWNPTHSQLKHTTTELPLLLKLINRVRVRSTYLLASEVAGWWTSCHYLFANTKWCLEPCSVTQYVGHQFIRVHNICFADYYPAWL